MPSATLPSGSLTRLATFGEPQLHVDGDLLTLAFAPDGTLWSVEEPGIVRHWKIEAGQQLEWNRLSDLETLWTFSRDTRVLASGSDDLTLWDTSSGHILTALGQDSWVSALAFHPDPAFVATGHDDGSVRYLDFAGHLVVHKLEHHKKPISALAFSGDGKILAAASEDKLISLWDVAKGTLIGLLKGHTDRIPALAWHPKKPILVSVGWDTTARVWDAATQQPLILLNNHSAQVTAATFSNDGSFLATADSSNKVRVWDFEQKREAHVLTGPELEVRSLAFSPDGSVLAATGDRLIHVWNTKTGESIGGAGTRATTATSIAAANGLVASNSGGLVTRIWNAAGKANPIAIPERAPVHMIAFSPDGKLLATATEKTLGLWNTNDGSLKATLDGPEEPITLVTFSPDGATLASASTTGVGVWIWRTSDGEPILLIPDALEGAAVQAIAFHPQGKVLAVGGIDWLATGGSNGAISLWNLEERAEIATIAEGATAVAFHPDGKRLASATLDSAVCLWDADNGALLDELDGHEGTIRALAYSPDGSLLASGSEDMTLRIWSARGEELAEIEVDSQVTSLAFSADGQHLFAGHANTTCSQYSLNDLRKRK
jgi:WD40 repeat protein